MKVLSKNALFCLMAAGIAANVGAQSLDQEAVTGMTNAATIAAALTRNDNRLDPAWVEVTTNPMGTAAFASYHTDMLDLDFTKGADLGQVYIAPRETNTAGLSEGYYRLQLREDAARGVVGLLYDASGAVVQRSKAHIEMMSFSPLAETIPEERVETMVHLDGDGLLIAAAHGDCWLVGSGGSAHGRCWIEIVPIEEIE
ncbi:MAG: hypothetical protein Tsb002_22340 [Wenzhouxiangellaceae bacterium]